MLGSAARTLMPRGMRPQWQFAPVSLRTPGLGMRREGQDVGCSPGSPHQSFQALVQPQPPRDGAASPWSVPAAASSCRATGHRRAMLAALPRTCALQGAIVIILQKPYGKLNQPQKTTLSSRYLIKYYRHRLTSLARYLLFHLSLEKLQAL